MASPDRREVRSIRTDRPDDATAERGDLDHSGLDHSGLEDSGLEDSGLDALPTVAEAIADPAFVAGYPEVVAGREALGNRVRWVHASDNVDVARFFEGGELLLSTGNGWPTGDAALASLVEGLSAAGVAGIVLELGSRFETAPRALLDASNRVGLPLVVLRREVRFVSLTEAIHRRIIGSQIDALRASAEVRERFTSLALRGAPADHVVAQLARTLSAPVVLENLAHEVVAAEAVGSADADVLGDWVRRSRAAHAAPPSEREWLIVPVDARGTRWGSLVALPGAAHPAGRLSVLEQGAIALAIGCLADGGANEWTRMARRGLLDGLLGGRFATAADAVARLQASGLPVNGRNLYGVAVSGGSSASAPLEPAAVESAAVAIGATARAIGLDDPPLPVTVALLSLPATRHLDEESARAFLKALGDGPRVSLTIGRAAIGIDEALASMHDAIDHSASGNAGDADAGARIRWADERPLAHLLNSLRDDHRLLDHGERMLAPLIEHDARTDGDLEAVLAAMLAHPSNRTAAAKASHLSRSVFYQRLAVIGSLLGADLDDGETQTALHIALLARRGRR